MNAGQLRTLLEGISDNTPVVLVTETEVTTVTGSVVREGDLDFEYLQGLDTDVAVTLEMVYGD